MIVCHHIRQLMVQKRSDCPGKRQKLDFFCFYRVTKTHQDTIASQIQGQVVNPIHAGISKTLLSELNKFGMGKYNHMTSPCAKFQVFWLKNDFIMIQ